MADLLVGGILSGSFSEQLTEVIKQLIREETNPLREKIEALEKEIALLKSGNSD